MEPLFQWRLDPPKGSDYVPVSFIATRYEASEQFKNARKGSTMHKIAAVNNEKTYWLIDPPRETCVQPLTFYGTKEEAREVANGLPARTRIVEVSADYNVARPKDAASSDTSSLLAARGKTHGDFTDHARAACRLKDVLQDECTQRVVRGQQPLTLKQREALDMIVHKIGRILAGDANFADHWDDIAGYALLAKK